MRIWTTSAAFMLCAPATAFAADYMSAEQAARLMFPDAERWDTATLTLDAAQLQTLDAQGARGRSTQWNMLVAHKGEALLGWVVIDSVVGKFELITYAVGLQRDSRIRQVEILSYRESHGHEVRLPAWRQQFVGKTAASPLRVGEDISNISGATLSCTHVTDGIRRIVAALELARRNNPAWMH